MKRLDRLSVIPLLVAGLGNLALLLLAFAVHVPVRDGSHNLIRTASGGYVEVPATPETYFQKYGFSELLLVGLGLVLVVAVAVALRERAGHQLADAGRLAWGLSIAALLLGIVGSATVAPYLLLVGFLLVLACSAFSRNGVAAKRETSQSASVTTGAVH
jgi:hypothetical protein